MYLPLHPGTVEKDGNHVIFSLVSEENTGGQNTVLELFTRSLALHQTYLPVLQVFAAWLSFSVHVILIYLCSRKWRLGLLPLLSGKARLVRRVTRTFSDVSLSSYTA